MQAVRATFVSTYTDPAKRIVNDNVNIGLAMGVVLLKVSFVADVSKCYTAYFAEVYEGFETNLTRAVGMVINVFLYIYVLRRLKVGHLPSSGKGILLKNLGDAPLTFYLLQKKNIKKDRTEKMNLWPDLKPSR